MPTIGWFEILIIAIVAIIVVGPKDFPIMLKKAGSWIGTAKKYMRDIQSEVSNIEKFSETTIDDSSEEFMFNEIKLTTIEKNLFNFISSLEPVVVFFQALNSVSSLNHFAPSLVDTLSLPTFGPLVTR